MEFHWNDTWPAFTGWAIAVVIWLAFTLWLRVRDLKAALADAIDTIEAIEFCEVVEAGKITKWRAVLNRTQDTSQK